MKRLIVIRHGQSEANRLEVHVGAKDSELSEEGRRQVRLLAESLKDEKIEAVYSSDLERAFLTANVIAKDHELEVIKDKRLREFDCGLKIASMGKNKRWIWWNDYRDKEAERFGLSSLDVKNSWW